MALSVKQELVAAALAQGKSQIQAAAVVGAGVRTVRRWCTEPEFKEAVRTAQRESYDTAIAKLVTCSSAAVVVLATIASNPGIAASARVSAAKAILELAHRAYSQAQLEKRLTTLEKQLSHES